MPKHGTAIAGRATLGGASPGRLQHRVRTAVKKKARSETTKTPVKLRHPSSARRRQHEISRPQALTMAYVDEEDALSFNVWVAELELLVGNARGNRRIDPIYSFDLLQKLQASIARSERVQLQTYQRKCEDALMTVLLKGAPPPVSQRIAQHACEHFCVCDSAA